MNIKRMWTKQEALDDLMEKYTKIGEPIAFSNPSTIQKYYGKSISIAEIQKYISSINTYTLHKEARKRARSYIPMVSLKPRQLVEIDLIGNFISPLMN